MAIPWQPRSAHPINIRSFTNGLLAVGVGDAPPGPTGPWRISMTRSMPKRLRSSTARPAQRSTPADSTGLIRVMTLFNLATLIPRASGSAGRLPTDCVGLGKVLHHRELIGSALLDHRVIDSKTVWTGLEREGGVLGQVSQPAASV